MKRIVVVGATSGIGREVARLFISKGWHVGVAGRREALLEELRLLAPERVACARIDITEADAPRRLLDLAQRLGGMDAVLLASGVGRQNHALDAAVELDTVRTNAEGFVRMCTAAFDYFRRHGGGRIAVISSIAGTRGLGAAPAYSATKRLQNTYIDALAQLARMERLKIRFTDIRPGFVDTALLAGGRYPLLMPVEKVARRIVRAVERGRRRAVIDRRYALLVALWRMIPDWLWERLPVGSRRK